MARTPATKAAASEQAVHGAGSGASPSSSRAVNGTSTRQPLRRTFTTRAPHSSGDTIPDEDVKMAYIHDLTNGDVVNGDHVESSNGVREMSVPIRGTQSTQTGSDVAVQNGLDIVGSRVKELLLAMKDLDHHGIDHNVPLPKIVVVGDQSAGKSSLIEAISEIKVPRNSETCTRCPLQINLTGRSEGDPNTSWVAHVSLVKKYDYYSLENSDPDTGLPYPLYPWVKKHGAPMTTTFHTVHNKEDLEEVIHYAQLMTLNPHQAPKDFHAAKAQVPKLTRRVEFSPNVISLDIIAPGIPDLSFYDLPGVISQAKDGKKETVDLVENLVREYILQENTLILLAVSMESDINNSKASGILNDTHANDRCVGVLTKPDRLPSDEPGAIWNKVLAGQAFQKGHGYFVVKQPIQRDLDRGITHEQARLAEDQFFQSNPDWTRRFRNFEDRLGTRKLQVALSQKLATLIVDSLPGVAEKIQIMLAEIEDELKNLPDPPANTLHTVGRVLSEFMKVLTEKIDGERQPNELSTSWKKIKKTFVTEIIEKQRPNLLVAEPHHARKSKSQQSTPSKRERGDDEIICLDDSDDGGSTPCPKPATTPTKKRKGLQASFASSFGSPAPSARSQKDQDPHKKRFRLEEIRLILNQFCASGLPDAVEPKAVDALIQQTLLNWHLPTYSLVDSLETVLRSALQATLQETAREWQTTLFFSEMKRVSQDIFLATHIGDLRSNVAARALRLERARPITENDKTWNRYIDEELKVFKDARFKNRSEYHFDTQDELTGKVTTSVERERKRQNERAKLMDVLGPDPYTREVEVMAKIRAYYQIASMRFVDHIRQSVEVDLFAQFRNGLRDELDEALKVTAQPPECIEYAAKLLDDDADRAQRRIELKEMKRSLEQAMRRLDDLRDQRGGFVQSQEL